MQHLVQIIQFAGEGSQDCVRLVMQAELESSLSLPSSSNTMDLKRSFIMIPLAGQKGNQVNYRLVCWLLIKPQLNIHKNTGEVPFPAPCLQPF